MPYVGMVCRLEAGLGMSIGKAKLRYRANLLGVSYANRVSLTQAEIDREVSEPRGDVGQFIILLQIRMLPSISGPTTKILN